MSNIFIMQGNCARTLFTVILSTFLLPAQAVVDSGVTVPSGFVAEIVAQGLVEPTAMEFAPDGRLFVAQSGGKLRVIKNGTLLPTPFLTVSVDSSGERGLLGVTFDPDFSSNQFVYIYYTVPGSPPHNRVARFTANGDVAAPGSSVLLELEPRSNSNHNGGAIHFGPDGKLYIAVGEHSEHSVPPNSQNLTNRLGKLLRLNSDGTLPSDNPTSFSGVSGTTSGVNRAIWAIGLRNPFTFSINRNTGRLIINDVGQATWEEVNIGSPGGNYGWPIKEGPTSDSNFTSPLYAYGHSGSTPSGCAITGGAFYDSPVAKFPSTYVGKYFFSDFCGNWVYFLDPDISNPTSTQFATGIASPVDLKAGPDGALYYLARGEGLVGRISSTSNDPPPPTGSGLVISQDTLEVREGSSRIFTVQLSTQPVGTVNVSITKVLSDQSVSVSPAKLSFSSSNWNIPRNITVFAGEDNNDRVDEGATINVSSQGLDTKRVVVTAIDNDRPTFPQAIITLPKNGDTVLRSGTAEFFGNGVSPVELTKARFYIDGVLKYTDSAVVSNRDKHYHYNGAHNSWNPAELSVGTHSLSMRVSDINGRSASHAVKVNIQ